jgi:putative spermidine/putrescine transport system permease protein
MAILPRICLTIVANAVLLFLMLPSVIVVVISFSTSPYLEFPPQHYGLVWYRSFFTSREWLAALEQSMRVALVTMCLATVFGTMLARVLAFRMSGPEWSLLRGVVLAPIIVPSALIGVGLFMLYVPLGLVNTLTGVVIAHLALTLPFVVFTVVAGIEALDPDLERVAQTLGATPAMAFWSVTLPLIRLSLLSGAVFAFIISFDESVIALFLTSGANATLPRKMFEHLNEELDPTIAAVAGLFIGLTTITLVTGFLLHVWRLKSQRRSGQNLRSRRRSPEPPESAPAPVRQEYRE